MQFISLNIYYKKYNQLYVIKCLGGIIIEIISKRGEFEKLHSSLIANVSESDSFHRIVGFTIDSLKSLSSSLECPNTFKNQLFNQIAMLENIDKTYTKDNIMPIIYQQELILMVSYLEAFLKDFFILFFKHNIRNVNTDNITVKFSLKDFFDPDKIGGLILEKDNQINFQNLTSIKKVITDIFRINFNNLFTDEEGKTVNYFLESRHLLVHRGGFIDDRFIRETSEGKIGDKITISRDEIKSFERLITRFSEKLTEYAINTQ